MKRKIAVVLFKFYKSSELFQNWGCTSVSLHPKSFFTCNIKIEKYCQPISEITLGSYTTDTVPFHTYNTLKSSTLQYKNKAVYIFPHVR